MTDSVQRTVPSRKQPDIAPSIQLVHDINSHNNGDEDGDKFEDVLDKEPWDNSMDNPELDVEIQRHLPRLTSQNATVNPPSAESLANGSKVLYTD